MVLVGGGPSFRKEDVAVLRRWQEESPDQRLILAINSSIFTVPFANALHAGDCCWWEKYHKDVKSLGVPECWTVNRTVHYRYAASVVRGIPGEGLCTTPGTVYLGGNSGYQAVGLAYQRGARRLILVGYDMQRTGGKSHHHGDHPNPLGNGNNFQGWIRRFAVMAKGLKAAGVTVVNASRATALTCFPRAKLEDALCESP